MTSPRALRGFRTTFRVTPRSTTSRSAAVNSRVSSGLMKRESDCSSTSSWRNPRSWDTASLARKILPSRSETNTGSGALAMMMSASSAPRDLTPLPSPSTTSRCVPSSSRRVMGGPSFRTVRKSAVSGCTHHHPHPRTSRQATAAREHPRTEDSGPPDGGACHLQTLGAAPSRVIATFAACYWCDRNSRPNTGRSP